MEGKHTSEVEEVVEDEVAPVNIISQRGRPRLIVEDWGLYKHMGPGLSNKPDAWYFHRPVFSHLWKNAYLGVGEDSKKEIM